MTAGQSVRYFRKIQVRYKIDMLLYDKIIYLTGGNPQNIHLLNILQRWNDGTMERWNDGAMEGWMERCATHWGEKSCVGRIPVSAHGRRRFQLESGRSRNVEQFKSEYPTCHCQHRTRKCVSDVIASRIFTIPSRSSRSTPAEPAAPCVIVPGAVACSSPPAPVPQTSHALGASAA